jgi:hypothetical protein
LSELEYFAKRIRFEMDIINLQPMALSGIAGFPPWSSKTDRQNYPGLRKDGPKGVHNSLPGRFLVIPL